MNTKMARILSMVLIIALAAGLASGCYGKKSGGTQNPEVQLDIISYTGSNATAYTQYQFEHNDICDIFSYSIFGSQEEQRNYLLDLSGYEFLSKYKTNDINQVTLEGAVYRWETAPSRQGKRRQKRGSRIFQKLFAALPRGTVIKIN